MLTRTFMLSPEGHACLEVSPRSRAPLTLAVCPSLHRPGSSPGLSGSLHTVPHPVLSPATQLSKLKILLFSLFPFPHNRAWYTVPGDSECFPINPPAQEERSDFVNVKSHTSTPSTLTFRRKKFLCTSQTAGFLLKHSVTWSVLLTTPAPKAPSAVLSSSGTVVR